FVTTTRYSVLVRSKRTKTTCLYFFFFFSSRRRHTRSKRDWSSDVCSSDLRTGRPSRPARSSIVAVARQAVGVARFVRAGRRAARPISQTLPATADADGRTCHIGHGGD